MGTFAGEKRQGAVHIRRVKGLNVLEAEIVYRVIGSSPTESRFSITSTPGLPIVGTTLFSPVGICKSKNAIRNTIQPLEWEVVCSFSSEVEEGTDPSTPQVGNPETWIPIAEILFEPYEELFAADASGRPFKNSAGGRLGPIALPRQVTRWDFFQFESASQSLRSISDRVDTVNPTPIFGCPTKCLRLTILKATLGYYYTYRCWLIDYSLRYKQERMLDDGRKVGGWQFLVEDMGAKIYEGGAVKDYYKGQPGVEGPLNGAGLRVMPHTNGPYLLVFDRYPTDPWQFLRLQSVPPPPP